MDTNRVLHRHSGQSIIVYNYVQKQCLNYLCFFITLPLESEAQELGSIGVTDIVKTYRVN